ncbi:hypothetical protein ACHQM5_026310 [Ranunculus cassubicifolius]
MNILDPFSSDDVPPLLSLNPAKSARRTMMAILVLVIHYKTGSMSHALKFNSMGLAVGPGSAELYTELEQLTLSQISVKYSSWRAVPHMEKDILWEDFKKKFPLRDSLKISYMKKAAETWRKHKSVLRKLLQPSKPFVSWLCAKPESITHDDWHIFCLNESGETNM